MHGRGGRVGKGGKGGRRGVVGRDGATVKGLVKGRVQNMINSI